MRRPAAWYVIRQLLKGHLPHLSGCLRTVLALWVEGLLLGLNGSPRYGYPGARLQRSPQPAHAAPPAALTSVFAQIFLKSTNLY